jgi:Transposase IS116/IS110/IS902 family
VPRQISTGDRTGKISKRGNRYLRVLFVQVAWVVLIRPQSWERHGLKSWIESAKTRLHHNVLAIPRPPASSSPCSDNQARGNGWATSPNRTRVSFVDGRGRTKESAEVK